jgi:Transglycosylase SLT domain
MRRLRLAIATAVMAVTALLAQQAAAVWGATGATTSAATSTTTTTAPSTTTTTAPSTTTTAPIPPPPASVQPPAAGVVVTPTPSHQPAPAKPPRPGGQGKGGGKEPSASGGLEGGGSKQGGKKPGKGAGTAKGENKQGSEHRTGAIPAPDTSPLSVAPLPVYPALSCGTGGAPSALLPIYQGAADAYGLGPQGPGVLAAINGIESGFGANLGPSSAGAIGWMQFLPSTWSVYGVDADGDGRADPNDPEDAIYSAARYLSAAGMPADTPGAIFAYNHADWYVAEVLANAGCYGIFDGTFSLTPGKQLIACTASENAPVPERYLHAFEQAASQYKLGGRGVWALAGVARLESDYGRGMSRQQLHRSGPLGLDRDEWNRFEVDGNGNGLIRHASIEDSAATLAREIWSRGNLRSGLFLHEQASWYVEQVLAQVDQISGRCRVRSVEWKVALPALTSAPIRWANLTLADRLEMRDIKSGALDPRIVSLLGMITQTHQVTVTALRSDHSEFTVEGNVSNHFFGRAMDIGAVDGVSCTNTDPSAPCGQLGRTLTLLPAPLHPTELIYCFDLDGPGPAFARADHCDHLHVGFDG